MKGNPMNIIKADRVAVSPVRRLREEAECVSVFVEAVPSEKNGLDLSYEVEIQRMNFKGLTDAVATDIARQFRDIVRRAERESNT